MALCFTSGLGAFRAREFYKMFVLFSAFSVRLFPSMDIYSFLFFLTWMKFWKFRTTCFFIKFVDGF